MSDRILLTGASGFLGSSLLNRLNSIAEVVPVLREVSGATKNSVIHEINSETDWSDSLRDISVVIHCAARAHIMRDKSIDPLTEYRKVNVDGTLNLARQAAKAGIRRFIFISSVKVNGESTTGLGPFTEQCQPSPVDAYGVSKKEAEEGLFSISGETGMEIVVVRPPLVYGPGVKANFLSLLKLASTGLPLPFGAIDNKRSMVYLGNLTDFIVRCVDHPAAANQVFLISDGEDVSLRSLLIELRSSFSCPPRLLPVPIFVFRFLGSLTGKKAAVDRLVGDLQVSSEKVRTLMEWSPPYSFAEGVEATVADFKSRRK